jgi:iron complex transport system permease protein
MQRSIRQHKNNIIPVVISVLAALTALVICTGLGSVSINAADSVRIVAHKLFGTDLTDSINEGMAAILWDIRIPRVITAFACGAALSVSGVVMQSVLRNPLASSYTLGVSSGASLGVVIIMVSGITVPLLGSLLMPLTGFIFGFLTVLAALALSQILDKHGRSDTIVLIGMVLSLFLNAVVTFVSQFFPDHRSRIALWLTGSFSGRNINHAAVMVAVTLVSVILLMFFSKELDIMTFGDEQGLSMGVEVKRVRNIVLAITALLTGVAVCLSGIIGFIDLIAPHVVRRVVGSRNRIVLPMAAIWGGIFMAMADMVSRTVLAPREIAVGAVTAIIGAPFFAYIYFARRKH